jgi:hypothetical protein
MKMFCIAALCLAFTAPAFAQSAENEPASRDEVILYLQTMHSHDMMQRMMEAQSKSMQQLMHDQFAEERQLPADFDVRMKKWMDDLTKNMPVDEMTQAMIPAYQRHFTKGDIEAMNAFYSSPVGQKVLQVLPDVTQEGLQEMMPILNKYLTDWKQRMRKDLQPQAAPGTQKDAPATN